MFDAAGSRWPSTAATDTAECHITSDSKPHERASNAAEGTRCGREKGVGSRFPKSRLKGQ